MRVRMKVPQWIPTALLVLLVPVFGYLVISNVEGIRTQQEAGAQTDTEAHLMAFMEDQYGSKLPRFGFTWIISRRDVQSRLVCYCDKKGYGWWYSVQIAPDGSFSASQVADTSAASQTSKLPNLSKPNP